MKLLRIFFSFVFLIGFVTNFSPAFADCDDPNTMDEQCDGVCRGKGKGCYLPPLPSPEDSKCPTEKYIYKSVDKICCCENEPT